MRPHGVRGGWIAVALATLLLIGSGCARSPEAPVDVQPSTAASGGAGTAECPEIDLRSPTGDRVDLSGAWEEHISDDQPPRMWWIRQIGTCVWAATMSPDFPESDVDGYDLQVLRGVVDSSFVIRAEITEVAPMHQPEITIWPVAASVRFMIDFDEAGEVVIREDRAAGVEGNRCPDPAFHCLPPSVLTRAD